MHDIKALGAVLAIGVVLGAGIGFPAAKVTQPVKTKTVNKIVQTKINNGESTNQMLASFGAPATVLSRPQRVVLPAGCATFVGQKQATSSSPRWIIVACAFTR